MIAGLVSIIILIIFISIFIGKNIAYECQIWFFKTFESTNVVIIAFISFTAGIIFALLFMLITKLINNSKKSAKEKDSLSDGKTKDKKQKNKIDSYKNKKEVLAASQSKASDNEDSKEDNKESDKEKETENKEESKTSENKSDEDKVSEEKEDASDKK